jgi:Hemerythrin HHE cation binding domain
VCEYCGCQAVTVIAELTGEHDAVVSMIGEARPALTRGEPGTAAAIARRIAAVLGPHTRVEEDGLFAGCRAEPGSDAAGARRSFTTVTHLPNINIGD